jgi:hypothetical protein
LSVDHKSVDHTRVHSLKAALLGNDKPGSDVTVTIKKKHTVS